MNLSRVRALKEAPHQSGPVVYWMSRDQRMNDNWAIIHAQNLALKHKMTLVVLFCLVPNFLGATIRQYGFMLKGLQEVEKELSKKNIQLIVLTGKPENEIPKFIKRNKIGIIVSDFSPLKINREWKEKIKRKIKVSFYEVDAHNIVPVWIASAKQEFGAYTIRPKINRLLPEYMDEFPKIKKQKLKLPFNIKSNDWNKITTTLKINYGISEIDWLKPGEQEARKAMEYFIQYRLKNYFANRNNPNKNAQSNLSPYLHFGQISAQRIALSIQKHEKHLKATEAFLEELIIRRELSDNFCFYNSNYDSFDGLPNWAKTTLNKHRDDKKDYIYSLKDLEKAATHDQLWNASQKEMIHTGKMHGYMRMYWAKKILEWTKSPEEAIKFAVFLNDKYEIDGRDPNGYTGIAWSIGGVHDRAWGERKVFGKIRYMNDKGCNRKFDIKTYIKENI
jgi:deoxyribodipyrimidine photo-lyase